MSRRPKPWLRSLILASSLGLPFCGGNTSVQSNGQTHWLEECTRDAQCGSELVCECGRCVSECSPSGTCSLAGREASCQARGSQAFQTLCQQSSALTGICLENCDASRACAGGFSCEGGSCIPAGAANGGGGAGGVDSGSQGGRDSEGGASGGAGGAQSSGTGTSGGGAGKGGAATTSTGGRIATGGAVAEGGRIDVGGSPAGGAADLSNARAAVVLGSCWGDEGVNRWLGRLWNFNSGPAFDRLGLIDANCIEAVHTGCGALETCLGWRKEPGVTDCTPGCNGTEHTSCPADGRVTLNCGSQLCDEDLVCTATPATACDNATFVPHCDGSTPIHCENGKITKGPLCSAYGLSCLQGTCVGNGAACVVASPSLDTRVRYEGVGCIDATTLRACVGGRLKTLVCPDPWEADFACQTVGDISFCGRGSECVPGDEPPGTHGTPEACEGSELVFCNAGVIDRIDCRDLGFSGCDLEAGNGCVE